MAKASILLLLLLASILSTSMVSLMALAAERENHSSSNSLGGILWSTGMAEGDLLAMADPSPVEEQTDEFAGGFSSLDGMLQWAIGHSDPAKLKEKASDIRRLSADELKKRQSELKELMEKLKMPSDAELMRIAIADLNNSSLSLEDRQRALNELLILVEPIDNANDLDKLGGLVAVVHELHNSEPEIRITSAWILGKASQNNALVQKQILSLGALTKLMKMVKSGSTEEAIKALYAISALVRNNNIGQELFFSENGDLVLQDIMNDSGADIRLHKKAVLLVSDLADYQLGNADNVKLPFFSNRLLLKSVVGLASSTDLDLQEKALSAIRSLLKLSSAEASVFKDFCDLDGVLERSREHLENLMTQEDLRDYARDIEALRREVYIIFHNKLARKGDIGANMNMLAR